MTLHNEQDTVRKQIEIKAPRSQVWRALTDYKEFSEWFGVNLESPFVAGQPSAGQMTDSDCKQIRMEVIVQKIEPEDYFSYTWHPYAIEPGVDYSHETPTLVEFTLEEMAGKTLITVTESGFSQIPSERRDEAFRKHGQGWEMQLKNIEEHVGKSK